jgi:hypothetical protein
MFKNHILVSLFAVAISLSACDKSEAITSGDGGLRYQAEEYTNLTEDAVFNEGRIYVDNVNLYEDMIGSVLSNALSATTNGNDERISDVTLANLEFSLVRFGIFPSEADSMTYHLESARLIMANSSFVEQKVEIATMVLVDGINGDVIFAPTTDDLLGWIESNRPDEMYFEYTLRNFTKAVGPLNVKYEILTSFGYSYESSEDK